LFYFSTTSQSVLRDISWPATKHITTLTAFYYPSFLLAWQTCCLVTFYTYVTSFPLSLHTADSDAETDEDEGHIEDAEKAQQREREKHDDSEEQSNKDIQDTEEDVAVSLLRAKNLSLLQSQ